MNILTFGEIMMRVVPEGNLRFRQAMPGKVDITFAGGEANAAASIALLGGKARYLTSLPDNAISDSLIANLASLGIDTTHILLSKKGRLGIFFLENGANQRSSNVLYDRDGSSIALAAPEDYNFDNALENVDWLHITGITPALSENAFLSTLTIVKKAQERSVRVSCDLNFRKKLWRWKSDCSPEQLARRCMTDILPFVDVVLANEEDAKDVLGIESEGTSVEDGLVNACAYEAVARTIIDKFANVSLVAITLRESLSATHNNWGGMLFDRKTGTAHFAPINLDGEYKPYQIKNIVDRVGGGDSFSGALIFALNSDDYRAPATAIAFAVAASCLKHSIKGDFNYVTKEEVVALMQGSISGRVRR